VFGNAAYLDDLVNVCRERNITIIEDATESLGTKYSEGKYQGKHAGTVGDFGCLSFNANKIITAGGGGMILTAQKKSAARARYLTTQAKDDEIRYIHNDVGYNFRLGNIQAALGVGQMENLGSYLKIKKDNYQTYKKGIDAIPGLHLASAPWYAENNHWMYALQIQRDKYGKSREELMAYLSRHNVQTRPVWYLNHRQKPYLRNQSYRIEKAPKMLDKTLNIPCSVGLSKDQINYLMDLLRYKRWGTR
jgi:dTDP-4-amino-4,6-dideoxygalactose transaminase